MILENQKTKLDLIIEHCLESIGANDDDNINTINKWFIMIGKGDDGAKERTKLSYIRTLIEFSNFIKMSPHDFIKECKVEKITIPDIDDRKITNYFINYKKAISDNAPKTIQRKITTIKSFCQTRNIELPFHEKKTKLALPKPENKHIPTKEEIREAINKTQNKRNKAIILVQASSGLASIDVRSLKISDLNIDDDNIITLDLRRIKTNIEYITFCSPEATEAINDYINYRNRPPFAKTPEKIAQYEKRRVRSDDDYIFINSKISDKYLESFDEKYRFISDGEIQLAYRLIEKNCKTQAPKGVHSYIRSHNIRKFFANTIKNQKLDYTTIETFLGHKVKGSLDNYTEADIKMLKEEYIKILPYISIFENIETKVLNSHEYSYNQASIEISNIKTNAMMELYPYLYRIIEDSKEIDRKYKNIIQLKKINNEKALQMIDKQYKNIDEIVQDRDYNEGELNHRKAEYQKQIDDINLKYKVNIPATFDQLKYNYETAEEARKKEVNSI